MDWMKIGWFSKIYSNLKVCSYMWYIILSYNFNKEYNFLYLKRKEKKFNRKEKRSLVYHIVKYL